MLLSGRQTQYKNRRQEAARTIMQPAKPKVRELQRFRPPDNKRWFVLNVAALSRMMRNPRGETSRRLKADAELLDEQMRTAVMLRGCWNVREKELLLRVVLARRSAMMSTSRRRQRVNTSDKAHIRHLQPVAPACFPAAAHSFSNAPACTSRLLFICSPPSCRKRRCGWCSRRFVRTGLG